MSKVNKKTYQQIAKIPALEPIKCIKDQQKFLQPSNPQEMWDNIHLLMDFYSRGGCLSKDLTEKILKKACDVLKKQPNVLYLSDPITIAGDIHGQFYDLIEHLEKMNIYSLIVLNNQKPVSKRKKVLFLGDYVDRGNFSVEVTILLLMLKIYLPKTFYLLRGNHECKQVTHMYNFRRQCQSKYHNQNIYELFIDLFWTLPLAASINGTFFCVHGGLSEELQTLSDLESSNRFGQIPRKGLICDLLWADPISNENGQIAQNQLSQFNKDRCCSIKFGSKLAKKFFERNEFMCLIRAHQVQQQGFGFLSWDNKSQFPHVITLFSAPNYCGGFNKGAIISIDKNVIDIHSLQKRPEPFVLPNFINAFEVSIPFIMAYLTDLFFFLLSPPVEPEQKLDTSSQDSSDILSKKDMKSPIWKRKKQKIKSDDHLIEQKILQKQEYLSKIYQFTRRYIRHNISLKWKLDDSRSRINATRALRNTPRET